MLLIIISYNLIIILMVEIIISKQKKSGKVIKPLPLLQKTQTINITHIVEINLLHF